MVTACLLVYLVRVLANRLAAVLPAPPAAGGCAEGSPAPHSPDAPAAARSKSEEAEAEGIKYEGYAEAIAGMQVRGKGGSGECIVFGTQKLWYGGCPAQALMAGDGQCWRP